MLLNDNRSSHRSRREYKADLDLTNISTSFTKKEEEEEVRAVIDNWLSEEDECLSEEGQNQEEQSLSSIVKQSRSSIVKQSRSSIVKKLNDEGILYFYHFTDINNLENIRQNGLYSRKYIENNAIPSKLGGNDYSRNLDIHKGLLDYVRLSFCVDHPMSYRLHQEGYQLVLLKICIDVVNKIPVLFSNINATDNNAIIKETLDHINFSAVKRTRVRRDDYDFKEHQAEILVLNHIPVEYIVNLDNPHPMFDTMLGMNNENKIQQEKSITELKKSISELEKKLNIKL